MKRLKRHQKIVKGTPSAVLLSLLIHAALFSKDGGFIFNAIHNILPEVPAENIVACFDAVKEFNGRSHEKHNPDHHHDLASAGRRSLGRRSAR